MEWKEFEAAGGTWEEFVDDVMHDFMGDSWDEINKKQERKKMIGRYEYDDLAAKALSGSATQVDIENLAEWFENYGRDYWNGEKYSIDSTHDLCPVYTETEPGEYEITGWEIR